MKRTILSKLMFVMASGLCVVITTAHAQNGAGTQNTNQTQNTTPNANASNPTKTQRKELTVPAEFQSGVAAMTAAKTALEGAGTEWGGHRIKAIRLINQALNACGQRDAATGQAQAKSPDQPAALQTGITQLTNAQNVFSQSTNAWGGRRDKAVNFINQALTELQAAQASEKTPKKPAN